MQVGEGACMEEEKGEKKKKALSQIVEEEKEKEKKKSFLLDSHIKILAGFLEWFGGYSN